MRTLASKAPAPAPDETLPVRDAGTAGLAVYAASGLSVVAALVHLWATPEHLLDWWAYGAFFLTVAFCQGIFAALLLRWSGVYPLLVAGILGNLAVVLVFVLTRTNGVPIGPHAGEVEGAGLLDVAATAAELGVVFTLTAMLGGRYRRATINAMLALGAALWALRLAGVIA